MVLILFQLLCYLLFVFLHCLSNLAFVLSKLNVGVLDQLYHKDKFLFKSVQLALIILGEYRMPVSYLVVQLMPRFFLNVLHLLFDACLIAQQVQEWEVVPCIRLLFHYVISLLV